MSRADKVMRGRAPKQKPPRAKSPEPKHGPRIKTEGLRGTRSTRSYIDEIGLFSKLGEMMGLVRDGKIDFSVSGATRARSTASSMDDIPDPVSDFSAFLEYMKLNGELNFLTGFANGEHTVTGRFRGRMEDGSSGGWDPRGREEFERREREYEHVRRKQEEGDEQKWHQTPPLDRMQIMARRYGMDAFLDTLSRVMEEMLDLESVLDVLGCELDMQDDPKDPRTWIDPGTKLKW